jgi:hypothetical protein
MEKFDSFAIVYTCGSCGCPGAASYCHDGLEQKVLVRRLLGRRHENEGSR